MAIKTNAKTEMQTLKSIDILSCAKICAVFGFVIGLILGLVLLVASVPFLFIPVLNVVGIVGFITSIITFTVLGFICGAVKAFIYNLVAGWIGGVKITLE